MSGELLRCTSLGALAAALNIFSFAPANAQNDEVESKQEIIVVTAQRREQSLMDVPLAVSAFSGEELQRKGVFGVSEMDQISPSLTFIAGSSSTAFGLVTRGIGNAGFGEGVEQSTGVALDGVNVGQGGSPFSSLFDIERIEVLRGPQGTLFGKNSTAGLISIITNAPTDELEASASLKYSSYDSYRGDMAVSGPVSDQLGLRLAGFFDQRNKGHLKNIVTGGTEGKYDRWGIRFRAAYEQGPFSLDASISYEEKDDNCCARVLRGFNENPALYNGRVRGFLIPLINNLGVQPGPDNRTIFTNVPNREQTKTVHGVLQASLEISENLEIRSISGYRNFESDVLNDSDTYPINFIHTPAFRSVRVFSQELQILGDITENVEFVGGLYYLNERKYRDASYIGDTFVSSVSGATSPNIGKTTFDSTLYTQNYSVYANFDYSIDPKWTVSLGARLIHEELKINSLRTGNYALFPGDFSPRKYSSNSDTDWVVRGSTQYAPNDNTMIFFSVARGYKGIGIDYATGGPIFTGDPDKAYVAPETVLSWEAGVRSNALDGKLNFSLIGFWSDYSNFQTDALNPETVQRELRNAGSVRTRGFEGELTLRPWTGGRINASGAFTNATFRKYPDAPCTIAQAAVRPAPCGQDLAGRALPGAPKWKFNISGQQNVRLSSTLEAFAGADYSWKDKLTYDLDLDPNTTQSAVGLTNFRLGLIVNDTVEIVGFVQNAFDIIYVNGITDYPLNTGAYAQISAPGRIWGLQVSARY